MFTFFKQKTDFFTKPREKFAMKYIVNGLISQLIPKAIKHGSGCFARFYQFRKINLHHSRVHHAEKTNGKWQLGWEPGTQKRNQE